jgi:hypothetical protein
MRRPLLLASAALIALLGSVALAGLTAYLKGWWPFTTPTAPGPVSVQVAPHSDSFSARNWSYYLRPVPTEKPGPRPAAEEAWDGLFPGMAADPATRELLRRLYGGLPVEFVVLGKEAADDALTKAPGEGFAVALRVANLGSRMEKTADGETLFGLIAIGRATFIKDVVPPPPGEGLSGALAGLVKTMTDRPSDGEALGLAVEDYMLRHQAGWLVVGGPIFEQGRQLPKDPQAHRADLDARIQAFAEKSADYYDKLRGKK